MNYREELLTEARKAIHNHPDHRSKIIDLLSLAVDEIEDGGSPAHEYELFMGEIEELNQGSQ